MSVILKHFTFSCPYSVIILLHMFSFPVLLYIPAYIFHISYRRLSFSFPCLCSFPSLYPAYMPIFPFGCFSFTLSCLVFIPAPFLRFMLPLFHSIAFPTLYPASFPFCRLPSLYPSPFPFCLYSIPLPFLRFILPLFHSVAFLRFILPYSLFFSVPLFSSISLFFISPCLISC